VTTTEPATGWLDGHVVVVTGAGRGIGRGIALHAAAQGARVVVADTGADLDGRGARSEVAEQVAAAARAAGGEAVAAAVDVSDLGGAERLVALAEDEYGPVDGLVCCAGLLIQGSVTATTEAEWDAVVDSHLKGHFACTRAVVPSMTARGRGRIVYFSSKAGITGGAIQPAYATAKAGVLGLLHSMDNALGPLGIGVNAVLPGGATRMTDMIWADADGRAVPGDADLLVKSDDAAGTWRDPGNVAPFVTYLLSARADAVRGEIFAVVGYQVTHVRPHTYGPTVRRDGPWDLAGLARDVEQVLLPSVDPWSLPWPPP
jgi:NAD(P)-dependent dehydrogenase (short-subunit alcohol dehydrogenase family)